MVDRHFGNFFLYGLPFLTKYTASISFSTHNNYKAGYILVMKLKQLWNMKKWKLYRVCLAHFTEHLFHIHISRHFARNGSFLMKCQRFLVENQNFMKMVKVRIGMFTHFHKTPWNTVWNRKCDKCVVGVKYLIFLYLIFSLEIFKL